jgi:hypothetical protein
MSMFFQARLRVADRATRALRALRERFANADAFELSRVTR